MIPVVASHFIKTIKMGGESLFYMDASLKLHEATVRILFQLSLENVKNIESNGL